MPIRQDDNQPNRRFGIVNIILIGVGALLLFSSLFPNQNMQIPRVPYSLFIDQVNDGEVKRAYITQEQIRYELKNRTVLTQKKQYRYGNCWFSL